MASKKKGARVLYAWLCSQCNKANYFTSSHRDTKPTALNKYCPACKKHESHKSKDKLK